MKQRFSLLCLLGVFVPSTWDLLKFQSTLTLIQSCRSWHPPVSTANYFTSVYEMLIVRSYLMFTVKQDTCYTKWMRNHLLLSFALRIIIRLWFSLSLVRTEWIKIVGHYLWIPTHTTIWKATMHVELGSATNELFSGSAVRFKNIELSTEKWKSKKKNQNFQVWSLTSFLVWHQTKKVIGTLLLLVMNFCRSYFHH